MTRLAELQFVTGSGNDISQSSGREKENHCWNTVSIQESHLEYKKKSTMDPQHLMKNASLGNGTRRKSVELLKNGDLRRNEKKENDLAGNRRKRQAQSLYGSESAKKMRKSAVSSHLPTTIPNSHNLVKGSSRIFPVESPNTLQSSKLTKMKLELPASNLTSAFTNGNVSKAEMKFSKVKTTQELIEDLLAKKKSQMFSITSQFGNYQVTSPTNSVSSDSELPKKEPRLEAYSRGSPVEQSLSKPSSKSGNIRSKKVKLANAKTVAQRFAETHLSNGKPSHNLSPTRNISDPESGPDKCPIIKLQNPQITSTRTSRSESVNMVTSEAPLVNCEDSGIVPLSCIVENSVPPMSVITYDTDNVSYVESVGNNDCALENPFISYGGSPHFEDCTDIPESNASAAESPGYHDPDPEHQNGIYGNHDAQGVWHPWQDWYDVQHSSDITVRILPYVMLD